MSTNEAARHPFTAALFTAEFEVGQMDVHSFEREAQALRNCIEGFERERDEAVNAHDTRLAEIRIEMTRNHARMLEQLFALRNGWAPAVLHEEV